MPTGENPYETYQLQPPEWSPQSSAQAHASHDGGNRMTMDQIDWLLKRLSTEDQYDLMQKSKQCLYKVTLTRGVPFAALITGSMYYARARLPESLRFGPKGWTFYALVGVASLAASNVLFAGKCSEELKPQLNALYRKYQGDASNSGTSYAAIRQQHRSASVAPSGVYEGASQRHDYGDKSLDDHSSLGSELKRRGVMPRPIDFTSKEPTFMSGTPYSNAEVSELKDPYSDTDALTRKESSKENFGGVEFS